MDCPNSAGRESPEPSSFESRLLSHRGESGAAAVVEAGVIERTAGIVCDAKSGVSGAGRKHRSSQFLRSHGELSAYSILDHRHVPEILWTSGLEEEEFELHRPIAAARSRDSGDDLFPDQGIKSTEELLGIYRKSYGDEPFVRLYPAGRLPDLHGVNRTNFCDIGVQYDPKTRRAVVISAIDNLGKGAAGQATQNMNLMLGYAETAGLL